MKEEAQAIAWWLSPENAATRKELAQRRPELELWLQKVEALVQQKLREVEKEEVASKA